MIINASGRTDICAFYSKWFINRIRNGYVDVRNPFFPKKITRIIINEENIDAIVFCTKNPIPILPYIDEIMKYNPIFHITITPYNKDIEPGVIDKKILIQKVMELSNKIGKNRIFLRYDPIFINEKYSISYHIHCFEKLLKLLSDRIDRIIISFVDIKKNSKKYHFKELTDEEIHIISKEFGKLAKKYNVKIQTCAEKYDLKKYGFINEACINASSIYKLTRKIVKLKKNKNRENCNCLESIDIGSYNTCKHFCKYCYANYDENNVIQNMKKHDINSSLLIGNIDNDDVIKIKM